MELYRLYDNETDEIALVETDAKPEEFDSLVEKTRDEYNSYNIEDLKNELKSHGYGFVFRTPNEVYF